MGLKLKYSRGKLGQLAWRKDPTILANVAKVQRLRAMRWSTSQIAEALHVSVPTIYSWVRMGQEIYAEQIVLNHHELVLDAVASFDLIIAEAWKHLVALGKTPGKNGSQVAALLNQAQNAEWKRAQLWNLVQDAAQAHITGMSEDEIRTQVERVAVRLGLRLVPLGASGTGETLAGGTGPPTEGDFFDPDGESDYTRESRTAAASELHEILSSDVPGGSPTLAVEAPALPGWSVGGRGEGEDQAADRAGPAPAGEGAGA